MYDTIFAEQHHKPAVALVNEGFLNDARSAAAGKGMPGARFVKQTVPCECTVTEKIEAGVADAMGDVIAALTTPLKPEEESPQPRPTEVTRGSVFSGDLLEVQRFFYKRGWTDGLPILPPTREAVDEMLTGTDLPPDHVVGKMIPRLGKATVEKIAINAVMAGALPTAMPILIAGIDAMLDPQSSFGIFEVSTGSWAPFFIINGPIREQIRLNGSTGALSPGDIANASIGRAMGLIVKNLGGARKGVEDMGVLGNPGKYSMVLAENEEASPWEPHHVQYGFGANDNCVTVSFPNSYVQIVPRGTDDRGHPRHDQGSSRPVLAAVHDADLPIACRHVGRGRLDSAVADQRDRAVPTRAPERRHRTSQRPRGGTCRRRRRPRRLDRPGPGRRPLGRPGPLRCPPTGTAW